MTKLSISVKNIEKSYKEIKALKAVSFDVNRGELYGFVGPDGSGKTTLFRILTTLLIPDKGSALVEGFDTVKDYKSIRKITGYMPGRFSLYLDLTVEENLKFYAGIFNTSIDENYSLIKDIYSHIEPFKTRKAGQLSGGMKQKLALSCALIHKPKVLFLDEPTTGVDAVSRFEFWELLNNLKKEGITIIVSTPYMDEASQCDRIALMQNGEILDIDTPKNIINKYPVSLYSVKSNNFHLLINHLRAYSHCESAFAFGDSVHLNFTNNSASIDDLTLYLQNNNHKDIQILQIKPSIEDCFMNLMNKI